MIRIPFIQQKKTCAQELTRRIPVVNQEATVEEVDRMLHQPTVDFETLNYIYILDRQQRLIGVASLRELFRQQLTVPVYSFAQKHRLITVKPSDRPVRAALLAVEHNIKAVPVVDSQGVFMGVLTSDTILQILHAEHVEDVLETAGIAHHGTRHSAKHILRGSVWLHLRKRLPWLILGVGGGLAAASVVHAFEASLQAQLLLAAFIPVVVYIADAVGSQAQTLFIRSVALDHHLALRAYAYREAGVGVLVALLLGVLLGLISYLWHGHILVSTVLFLSIIGTTLIAVTSAIVMPLVCMRLRLDPAITSGPLATIVRDVVSLTVYFLVAVAIL